MSKCVFFVFSGEIHIISLKLKIIFQYMSTVQYQTVYKDKEIINFIEYFLTSAHVNMDIEDEAVFSREELY